ncbi:hypothetical protein C9374_013756 [Naegleria lovaniensis]|uniref:F-box domain-containing protein n=1 Tax=Naegleria lovaniensis TaxID=51637 RepID=A0AA88G573_NAELO|nr:uncharacterized protein C9374_013756 [Naegleria lovaniensis]KAG2370881.1 hypothetical protein C9374_013756 [Naegleria lovaniensis]
MSSPISQDVLFHIFTSFCSPNQYLNNLMLVCKDWYHITTLEMFWMKTLQKELELEFQNFSKHHREDHDEKEQQVDYLIHPSHYFDNSNCYRFKLLYKSSLFRRDRGRYLKYLEKINEIYIVKQQPMEKRRLCNMDIYGTTYKKETIQFFKRRALQRIKFTMESMLLECQAIAIESPFLQALNKILMIWSQKIIPYLFSKPFGKSPKELCEIPLGNAMLLTNLCLQYLQFSHHDNRTMDFLSPIIEKLILEGHASLCSALHVLLKIDMGFLLKHVNTSCSNSKITFLELLEMEIQQFPSNVKWIDSSILAQLSQPHENYEELQQRLISLIKRVRRRDFFPLMIQPHVTTIYENIATIGNKGWLKFFLCDIGIARWKGFKEESLSPLLFSLPSTTVVPKQSMSLKKYLEFFRSMKLEMGFTFSSVKNLERLVVNPNDTFELLKFLIDECGVDPKLGHSLLEYALTAGIYGNKTREVLFLLENGVVLQNDLHFIDRQIIMILSGHSHYYEICYDNRVSSFVELFYAPESEYLSAIHIIMEKTGKKLSSLQYFLMSVLCFGNYSLEGLKLVLNTLPKECQFKIDGKYSTIMSQIFWNWTSIAIKGEEGRAVQTMFLRFIESTFPDVKMA